VSALNSIYNIDDKKFKYEKYNLLQIYYNSFLESLRNTFINKNIYINDELINSNNLERLENLKFKNQTKHLENITLLSNLISGENSIDNSEKKQEIRILEYSPIQNRKPSEDILKFSKYKSNKNIRILSIVNYINKNKFLLDELKNPKDLNSMNILEPPDELIIDKWNLLSNMSITTKNEKYKKFKSQISNLTLNTDSNLSILITNINKTDENSNNEIVNFIPGEVYYFMNNITQYEYSGRWKGSNPNNMFEQSEGAMNMEIKKNQSQEVFNLIPNIEYFRTLYFTFNAKDGDYRDNWMIFNFTLKFPKNFYKNFIKNKNHNYNYNDTFEKISFNSNTILENNNDKKNEEIILNSNQNLKLMEDNVKIKYYIGELFEAKNITECNRSIVELEFIRDPLFKVENFDYINSIEYSKINGKIVDLDCNFKFDFFLQIETQEVILNF